MADLGGLGIGTVSLALQLFQSALAAYSIYTTSKEFASDAGVLQAQLLIQEQLLARWGDSLGLTKSGEENGLDDRLRTETCLFNAVVATLGSIKSIFLELDKLRRRYSVASKEEEQRGDDNQNTSLSKLVTPSGGLLSGDLLVRDHGRRMEELEATRKGLSMMKLFRWSVKDKGKFEALVKELARLNTGLYSLIPPLDARILAKSILSELLRTTDLGRLQDLRVAAQDLNPDVASAAGLKHLALTIKRNPTAADEMELPLGAEGVSVSVSVIRSSSSAQSRRCTGKYSDPRNPPQDNQSRAVNVLIEWRDFEGLIGELRTITEVRVNNLSSFLHQQDKSDGLRALNCIGYIKTSGHSSDHLKFGLVYRFPEFASDLIPPISLYELLPEDEHDEGTSHEFNLGDKFRLAQTIAQSLYELHVSNWLHKAICSDNVVYFQRGSGLGRRGGTGKISASSPFLAGYGLARTGRLSDPTQKAGGIAIDLYAHPQYRDGKARYRRLFDIYSLGVVLLEVGLWRRVESGVSPEQMPEQVRDMLVDTCMAELGPAMGEIYRDAVRCCLLGDFPVDGLTSDEPALKLEALSVGEVAMAEAHNERINDDLTAAFYWKVVKMLGKCSA